MYAEQTFKSFDTFVPGTAKKKFLGKNTIKPEGTCTCMCKQNCCPVIWRYIDLVQKKTCDFTATVNK